MAAKDMLQDLVGSAIFMIVAVVMVAKTARDICFYLDKEVVAVNTPADIARLHDNQVAEISLGLDFKKACGISFISKREFLLIPFYGAGYRLMYVVEGPMSDKFVASLRPPVKGRVVEKDFANSWDVYDQPIELKSIFERDRLELPEGAMLVYDAPKEFPSLWLLFISGVSVVYLLYKGYVLSRLFRLQPKPTIIPL